MSHQQSDPPPSSGPPGGSVVIVAGAALALLAMVLVIMIDRRSAGDDAGAARAWIAPPTAEPEVLIPLQSDPPSPASSFALSPIAAATGKPLPVARPPSPGRTPSRAATRLLPEPGSRLSLLAAGTTGLALRHQDFRVRLAPVGPRSPAAVRADATFVLRRGLSDSKCVSFESVNFPGRFVRHQNFVLVLQPRESSPLFAADATFCPRAAGDAGDFELRPTNYPDRHVSSDGSRVLLGKRSAGPAQRFRAATGF
ncbi:AbfB domain-containing protein [Actinoplanes friuliensis]|uniref:Arabinofuranosidase n=1 Tax=Actinoplanes friuliensis DSM 7358 TaxID=1246995 RepID=U5VW21_9ACTN|nr:AbfB domain-containing protein [Actinoplanes friuliensis]AGZ41173.1 arabinofuranosidase [Actinoplanes friuliensis DSM 7358]